MDLTTNVNSAEVVSDTEAKEIMPGIYQVVYPPMANMTLERIVVSNPAIIEILKMTHITKAEQEAAVDALVARTLDWYNLSTEVQFAKIKSVLTMESVIEYLRSIETLRAQCDVLEVGVDPEGSIVVEAYYTTMNREQRRAAEAAMSDADKTKLEEATNMFGVFNEDNKLIDLAKAKLEKLAKAKGK